MKRLSKTSVLLHLDTSHQRKADGKSRFYLKVRAKGKVKLYDITPELYMDKKYWVHEVDVETMKARKRMRIAHAKGNANSRRLEQQLMEKLNTLLEIVNEIERRGLEVTHEVLATKWRTVGAVTLCDFIAFRLEEEKQSLAFGTHRGARLFLEMLRDYAKDIKLSEITADWIHGFEKFLRYEKINLNTGESGLAGNTIATHFNRLRKYMRYAYMKELIPRNPMDTFLIDGGGLKRLRTNVPIRETLSASEIDLLHKAFKEGVFKTIGPKNQRMHFVLQAMLASIYTGFRISDIRQFYKVGQVKVTETHLTLVMTKVKRSISIKITNRLREVITLAPEKPLLDGGEVSKNTMARYFGSILSFLGIEKEMSWHDLRRTFATQLQINNVDINKVSKLLGHSSVSVTERYAKVRNQDLDTAMDIWDATDEPIPEKNENQELLALIADMVKRNPDADLPPALIAKLAKHNPTFRKTIITLVS